MNAVARSVLALPRTRQAGTPLPQADARWALLFDVDGCIVETQRRAADVRIPESLLVTLKALKTELGGALAVISGRTLEQLDNLFAPLQLPSAGLHGIERRAADGHKHMAPLPNKAASDAVHRQCYRLLPRFSELNIEDKGSAIVLRYKSAPQLGTTIAAALGEILAPYADTFELQPGDGEVEVKPVSSDNGSALRAFMRETPFVARMPVFLGHDLADESAFLAANALGGISIGVGIERDTWANFHLTDPAAARVWLAQMQQTLGGGLHA
jgi:trehalose 6-phosphate phosphatase